MRFNPTRHGYAVAATARATDLCVTETRTSPVQLVNYIKRLAHVGCPYMPFVGMGAPLLKCLNPPSSAALPEIGDRCVVWPPHFDYVIFALLRSSTLPFNVQPF